MSEPQRKPDIREQVGSAVNSSHLAMRSYETPLERVAAVGAATLALRTGAASRDLPVSEMANAPINPQEYIAAELSAMLWHVIFGRRDDYQQRTATVFAAWLRYRPRLRDCTDTEISVLAMRSITEMLRDHCQACGGSKKQEFTEHGNWVRPRGMGNRSPRFRSCEHCHGSGRALPCHAERMHLLGLTREKYDAANWPLHFAAAHAWLTSRIARLKRPLTAELERRTRQP